ncbi:MAG: hypothetical protein BRD48_01810 [Bacteroidetes bacterium QS_9_68_14]|nr:MAG: hypothetical protein BRD48_01810 [Bacteroidetes bacterium QS_9_68_14]
MSTGKRLIVYVEGRSDALALRALLAPLLDRKLREDGARVEFFEAPAGDRKESVLMRVPRKAANILRGDPQALVAALPDLYPPNKAFDHETVEELRSGIRKHFRTCLREKGIDDERMERRFKVFCFKHDFEALVLAARDALLRHLDADAFATSWHTPVEDQNHDKPPKRIVEELFAAHDRKYVETVDAPRILGNAHYETVVERCPQCFAPFVDFLAGL